MQTKYDTKTRKTLDFTKKQLSGVFIKHLDRERGLQDLIEVMIESMMRAEPREFLDYSTGNKRNVYSRDKSY